MICFKGIDGSVAIMELAPGANKDEAIQKFRDSQPEGFYPEYREDVKLPKDRQFRDAWVMQRGEVKVDQKKAEAIHLDSIRKLRNKKLKTLDVEALKVITEPEKLHAIEKQKQKLRDLPQQYQFDIKKPDIPAELL